MVKPVDRCVAFGILYFTLRDTRTFELLYSSLLRFFLHYARVCQIPLSTQIFSGEFFFMFFMVVFMVFFPTGVFLYQMLETVLSMTVR